MMNVKDLIKVEPSELLGTPACTAVVLRFTTIGDTDVAEVMCDDESDSCFVTVSSPHYVVSDFGDVFA